MNGQRGRMHRLVGRALVGLTTTALAVGLLAPAAAASPIGDAEAAMMAAWDKAGGASSPLGARKGDVYPVGDGFVLDFDGGKMFYSTATGAKDVYGPILDKYESLGGPAGSDLGWPTIDEVPGLSGPNSRVSTFSASDKPVIFWTPDHGAFVVRGALNAAWDKLGSSGGVLGVPVGDETYDGQVTSQKFSGGQVSWNRQTKQFTTDPAVLADQLKGLQVPIDAAAAINMAWRAAGGPNGPLGAKQGGQYPIGGDGIAQNFAGGKVYFSPATGANALESDILAKYESLGGAAGSDLGFPIANESDGGIPSSRIATFSGADKPVIFWTSDHGAFVVRGAMKAAWDKLRGPTGKLGAPLGDQAVDGDVITQKFAGGSISWNRAKNAFTTDPANLAPLLSGLQVSGQNQPSTSATPSRAGWFASHWWWLLIAIPLLILVVLAVLLAPRWLARRAGRAAKHGGDVDGFDDDWGHDDDDLATEHFPLGDLHPPERPDDGVSAPLAGWGSGGGAAAGLAEDVRRAGPYGGETPSGSEEGAGGFDDLGIDDDENPDAVDTDSIPVVSEAALSEEGYPDVIPEDGYPDVVSEEGYPEVAAEGGYPELVTEDGYALAEDAYPDVAAEDAYPDGLADAEAYPDLALPHTPADAADQDAAYLVGDNTDAAAEDVEYPDVAVAHTAPDIAFAEAAAPDVVAPVVPDIVAPVRSRRAGRHAAADTDDELGFVPRSTIAGAAGRPTIHMPLDDPYQVPDGYPIKASARFGLYYTPDSDLYQDTLAEIWLASEEIALANGFIRAD